MTSVLMCGIAFSPQLALPVRVLDSVTVAVAMASVVVLSSAVIVAMHQAVRIKEGGKEIKHSEGCENGLRFFVLWER